MFLRASLFGGFGILVLTLILSVAVNLVDHPGALSLTLAGLALGSVIVAMIAVLRVARPLGRLAPVALKMMEGDTAVDVPDTGRTDEIGAIARGLAAFRTSAG